MLAGVIRTTPLQAFSRVIRSDVSPKDIVRLVRLMRELLSKFDTPVFAIADTQYETSETFLMSVGFKPVDGTERLFQWM